MTHTFEKDYWESHWHESRAGQDALAPNPHLIREVAALHPGTALDAGCGTGAEAIWLAARGWQVTGADISATALARAADAAARAKVSDRVTWVEADLTSWHPGTGFDLVVTNYAHPAMPQLDFYDRIADWVAPGGTLLIVGHLHDPNPADHDHGDHPPEEATVELADVTNRLDPATWTIETAEEQIRTLDEADGNAFRLRDVIVCATRRG
jgi:SAM-dependent methyltransferase